MFHIALGQRRTTGKERIRFYDLRVTGKAKGERKTVLRFMYYVLRKTTPHPSPLPEGEGVNLVNAPGVNDGTASVSIQGCWVVSPGCGRFPQWLTPRGR